MIDLNIGLEKVDFIYHLSDIHIRNFKRHAEYRRVFRKLVKFIKKDKKLNSIIFVTGDIVHSKNDITPELVREVTYFFKLLGDTLPTIIFPGNHDANLNNNNRLDSLSPIIDAIQHPNIFYVKDTNTFKLGDKSITHWSVFDSPDKYIKADSIDSQYKIAVYHGPVNSSTTEIGFNVSNNCISVSDFNGFDVVLLGDIHKMQFLNEDKTIAYPGSLLQQSHAESLDHGILVWDLENKSSEYVKIENDTCFYTLDVDSGVHKDIPDNVPNKLYLRLRCKNTNHSSIKQIISEIKKSRDIIEVSIQKINDFNNLNNHITDISSINVRDILYQEKLISDFLQNKFPDIKQEAIKKVIELNKIINLSIQKLETTRNIQWIPKKFEFSNMFSYGKNNFIDFTNMTGTYGVFAPNASGKSSLLEAISYCIFDKCSKTSKASQVMNNKAKDFYCKLEFELDGKTYFIEREAKKQKSEHVKVNVDFYYIDKLGNKVSLNGEDRYSTDQAIRNILGTYEDFVLTSLSIQNNNTGFIDMGQTDRKNLLSQFLDISVFDELYNIANENIKEYSILIKEYKKNDYGIQLEDIESKMKQHSTEYRDLQNRKVDLEKEIDSHNKSIMDLKVKLVDVDKEILDIDGLKQNKNNIEKDIEKINKVIQEYKDKIQSTDAQIEKIQLSMSQFDLEVIQSEVEALKEATKEYNEMRIEMEKHKSEMTHNLKKMENLSKLEYDENCHFCMNNIFVKDAIETKKSIKKDEQILNDLVEKMKTTKERIDSLNGSQEQKQKYDDFNSHNQRLQSNKLKLEAEFSQNQVNLSKLESNLKDIELKINNHNEKESVIQNNEILEKEILNLSKIIDLSKDVLNDLNNQIIECNSNIQFYHKQKQNVEESIIKLSQLEDQYKYYEYYLSAVCRDGIPYSLISSAIPKIQDDINNILTQIVDFQILIHSDGKNINAYIVYDNDRFWPIELSSGMEKFISSIAIRTSLINASSLPRPNFLGIDEGFGALDHSNMSNISILMDYLKTQFKFIIMISHIDSIKDVVDNHIEVVKNKEGTSKVNYE